MIETYTIWWVFWLAVTFWLSKSIIPVLITTADRYNLYDDPDGGRKVHSDAVPTLGGIAIFLSFIVSFSFMIGYGDNQVSTYFEGYGFLVAASVILFGIGIKDDILGLSPKKKLLAQVAASLMVIGGVGLQFSSLGGIFGIQEIHPVAGFLLTLFTMIVIINAYNLIDGIDGLAGGVGLIASLFFGYWFWQAGLIQWAVFSTLLASALIGFLWYNFSPATIFMGDTGSLIVGFLISMQTVAFVHHGMLVETSTSWQHAIPVIAMAVLVIPLYDTLRVFVVRVSRGQSPFTPDRSHLHHFLLDTGCNHRDAMIILSLANIFFIGLAVLLANTLSNTELLMTLLGATLLIFPTNGWKSRLLAPLLTKRNAPDIVRETVERQLRPIPSELLEEFHIAEKAMDIDEEKQSRKQKREAELV